MVVLRIITFIFGYEYGESAIIFRIMILIFLIQMFGFGYLLRGFGMTRPILPANIVKMVMDMKTQKVMCQKKIRKKL